MGDVRVARWITWRSSLFVRARLAGGKTAWTGGAGWTRGASEPVTLHAEEQTPHDAAPRRASPLMRLIACLRFSLWSGSRRRETVRWGRDIEGREACQYSLPPTP